MIICFNDKINSFNKISKENVSLTNEYIQSLMPSCEDIHCNCPKCKAKSNFSYHGSYTRNLTLIREANIYDFKVKVTRVICNSCGSTHALLPNFIVPYKIFSRDSILSTVASKASTSVIKVSREIGISMQLIYNFILLIMKFFPHAHSLNLEQKWYKNFNEKFFTLNCLTICNDEFHIKFFERYKWVFLMDKFQNNKAPPITIGINLILPHNF